MTKIEMYTTIPCGYCDRAKEIFASKNLPYTEYNILLNQNYFKEMIKRSKGKRTMPQIFINNIHVGGYDELKNLILDGEFQKIVDSK
tara:strand:- start:4926 stop:5186 length:261 start_codon:yes stop_codon:yes gene_type:complete